MTLVGTTLKWMLESTMKCMCESIKNPFNSTLEGKIFFSHSSPWVSRKSCTRWVLGSDVIYEGFPFLGPIRCRNSANPGWIESSWLTRSVLSLLWSIVYVAGKGLMGYIHVQTMLTSPAILGLLFLKIPKSNYLFWENYTIFTLKVPENFQFPRNSWKY